MVKQKNDRKNPIKKIHFKVSFEERPDFKGEVRAYAFDQVGNLLASAPVRDGAAALELTPGQARRAQLFFAPALPGSDDQAPTRKQMEFRSAYQPAWSYRADQDVYEMLPVPGSMLDAWLLCLCQIRGRVVKSTSTDSDAPVCGARVHICEVDQYPRFILELPDREVFRFRDDLLLLLKEKLIRPRKFPEPGPWPPVAGGLGHDAAFVADFDPSQIDPSPLNIARAMRNRMRIPQRDYASGTPMPIPPSSQRPIGTCSSAAMAGRGGETDLSPQPEPPDMPVSPIDWTRTPALAELGPQPEPPDLPDWERLPVEFQIGVTSRSVQQVRDALIASPELVLPLLCFWPWWWWFSCDEIAVVETDHNGRFDVLRSGLCGSDTPDLYFWVEYLIDGVWTILHKPPIPCSTHWNYVCGDDVTVRITDPRVPVCSGPPDLPGSKVAIMTIGNNVSFADIQPASAGANEGLTSDGRPFGGKLEPQVWFSRTSLFTKGVSHYRWSYRRLTGPDGVTAAVGSWQHLDRQVVRHYSVRDPVTDELSFPADPMGPDASHPGHNLFRIQPIDPPTGDDWAVRDAREDLASAHFRTHLLEGGDALAAAGKYELKLELFDDSDPSTPVDLTDLDIDVEVSDQSAPYGTDTVTTDPAPADNLIVDGAGHVRGFRMVLRIDNSPCEAQIHTITGAGLSMPNPNCGFIEYLPGASANISFTARHPNGFATFRFEVTRGSGNTVDEASASGSIIPLTIDTYSGPPDGPFSRNTSYTYSKSVPAVTLLTSGGSGPACTRAAFAETLYVNARATDGWGTLDYLDARATPYAFALDQPD